MNALQQRVEVEAAVVGGRHDDLTIDDTALWQRSEQRREQFREVARERPLVAAGQLDRITVAEHDATEAVPLRLVQPTVTNRDLGRCLREHWRQWRLERQ